MSMLEEIVFAFSPAIINEYPSRGRLITFVYLFSLNTKA